MTRHVILSMLLCTILFFLSTTSDHRTTNPSRVPKKAVLLSKIHSLTLRAGKLTSSRRVDPIPQLQCVGPEDVCKLYEVDVMRCKNEGVDYDADNVQWSCKASLPAEFKLGSTDVLCEGYESSEDPYILKGSCGVEYRLLLTQKGEEQFKYMRFREQTPQIEATASGAGALFLILFLVVLFIILKSLWSSARRNPPRLGGGGGANNGGFDDPPPPYDGPPAYSATPKKQTATASSTRSSTTRTQSSSSRAGTSHTRAQQDQSAWRPGFWTGALTGAAAGYGASQYQNRRAAQSQPQERTATGGGDRSSSSNSAPSFSQQRHESTGFGETRRR